MSINSEFTYSPKGVCSRQIDIQVKDGIVGKVVFTGGCHGNAQAVSRLVEGLSVEQVIARLAGIDCRSKGTSCPDQLSKALSEYISKTT